MLGFPIRTSPDQRLVGDSPRLNAASHVLHRLLMPRHPPCALKNLATKMLASTMQFTNNNQANQPTPPPNTPTPHITEEGGSRYGRRPAPEGQQTLHQAATATTAVARRTVRSLRTQQCARTNQAPPDASPLRRPPVKETRGGTHPGSRTRPIRITSAPLMSSPSREHASLNPAWTKPSDSPQRVNPSGPAGAP